MIDLDRRVLLAGALGAAGLAAFPAAARSGGFFARHGLPIGVQIYTVAEAADKDPAGALSRLAAIGYRTVELMQSARKNPSQWRAAADQAGLKIRSIQLNNVELGTTVEDAKRVARDVRILGVSDVVIPFVPYSSGSAPGGGGLDGFIDRNIHSKGADLWHRLAAYLNDRGSALKREGLRFSYHNHNVEFKPIGETTGWDILWQETDPALVGFEVDIGWVASAGVDPVKFIQRYKGRVGIMHVKDLLKSTKPNFALHTDPAEVGSGMIDWPSLLDAAYRSGVRQFFVEQEPPFTIDRFEALAKSYAFLSRSV